MASEDDNEEVRELARKLAPVLEKAEELLQHQVPEDMFTTATKSAASEDDDMDREVEALELSEQILRQELAMADDFPDFFAEKTTSLTLSTPQALETEADDEPDEPEEDNPPPTPSLQPVPSSPEVDQNANLLVSPRLSHDQQYRYADHYQHLRISLDAGWYAVTLADGLKEYCLSYPNVKRKLLVPEPEERELAVRTLTLRLRPDVLCGAVMDSVHQALTNLDARLDKRQGGHLCGMVPGAKVVEPAAFEDLYLQEEGATISETQTKEYVPFRIDVQVATRKTEACERELLVRVYHAGPSEPLPPVTLEERISEKTSMHLREACALVQRMNQPDGAKKVRPQSHASFQQAVSSHLLDRYRPCPSVLEEKTTFPSLNSEDWPVIVSSWRAVEAIVEELDSRDATYSTLSTLRFGSFPALPTLDVHYCSQMRRWSRENMVTQLLKSAGELEDFAREAEYKCANMISLLQPTFESYGIEPPTLPKAEPLTSYPFKFVAPQTTCPPWGAKVMEALNQVQARSSEGSSELPVLQPGEMLAMNAEDSYRRAEEAVRLVRDAFSKQDDEEQSARLDRKNAQVMDRLAKMQEHQRQSVEALSAGPTTAADEFEAKSGVREVPLLKWNVVVGSAPGTCHFTANHLFFSTQLIPVIGGLTTTLVKLSEVEFRLLEEGSPSILNPLPTVIQVLKNGEEELRFRPSSGGSRLLSFLEVLQSVQ